MVLEKYSRTRVDFSSAGTFSKLFFDYMDRKESVKEFYDLFPSIENFAGQLEKKKNFKGRQPLHDALIKQYESVGLTEAVKANVELLLDEKTFTVTTGHQLNLFTGPLYFVYKIITVINLAQRLKEKYPGYNFVPLYWMNSEDHDFEEISYFYLFGKKHTWENKQEGASGRYSTQGIETIIASIQEKLPFMEEAYLKHSKLAEAHRYLVDQLFGKDGLVILDSDDRILKSQFKDYIKDEITEQTSYRIVGETNLKLEAMGYHLQVNPREINLFFLEDGLRERIIQEGENYRVGKTDRAFTREQILQLIEESPEKFSNNVVTRPLYQEVILPNLAYIGGPAEVVYWMQYKALFDHYKIPFPILMPRVFALVISKVSCRKMSKFGLDAEKLFLSAEELKKQYVAEKLKESFDVDAADQYFEKGFAELLNAATATDKSLEGWVLAERQKVEKSVDNIKKRLRKAAEDKDKAEIDQLLKLKEKLFPENSLQERVENFLNFYVNDPDFIEQMKKEFDPFDFSFNVFTENE